MAISSKRLKVDVDCTKTLIYIIPQKIQKRRLDIIVTRSREKGFPVTDIFWYVAHIHIGPTNNFLTRLSYIKYLLCIGLGTRAYWPHGIGQSLTCPQVNKCHFGCTHLESHAL